MTFDKGITAVVGPNGSGKSNISDAIRWVLGEQSAKYLRGSKMEDVIFSGSGKRRALGVAEVTVDFDNSDRTLPLDFEQVSLTRRIFRSGESEYAINKKSCRLKDIIDLMADTGLGMSQKDIDHIFQRFYRSDQVRNEKISGHGLGLSIAKLIILKHSGSIKIKSQLTRGSSFQIILPKIRV